MAKIYVLAGMLFFFLIAISTVYACEPCSGRLNFEETVEKSDLIIVGQRTDCCWNKSDPKPPSANINVKVIEILKGDTNKRNITVNSYNDICPYGITINDEKKYIMLLEGKGNMYDAVHDGCAVKTYKVENNLVHFEGDKISIDKFTDKLGSQESRQITNNNTDSQSGSLDTENKSEPKIANNNNDSPPSLLYFIGAVLILIVLFFIIKRRK